jgi:cell division protein FtsB
MSRVYIDRIKELLSQNDKLLNQNQKLKAENNQLKLVLRDMLESERFPMKMKHYTYLDSDMFYNVKKLIKEKPPVG